MPRPGGNPNLKGNKNSGRRKFEVEIKNIKEIIRQKTIEELAKDKVYNHLKMTEDKDRQGIKDIALPVYLKSKADNTNLNINLVISKEEDEAIKNYEKYTETEGSNNGS